MAKPEVGRVLKTLSLGEFFVVGQIGGGVAGQIYGADYPSKDNCIWKRRVRKKLWPKKVLGPIKFFSSFLSAKVQQIV